MATRNAQRQTGQRQGTPRGQRQGGGQPQKGGYSTGGGYSIGKGGGTGRHPAHNYGDIASKEGHFRYCYRLIENARDGRAGALMAFGHLREQIMRQRGKTEADTLTPDEKKYLIRRLRREYRGLSASFDAQARRAARVARVRQDADLVVGSGEIRARQMNGRGWARRIG